MKITRCFNNLIFTGLIVIFIAAPEHLIAQISSEFESYMNERMEHDQISGLSSDSHPGLVLYLFHNPLENYSPFERSASKWRLFS